MTFFARIALPFVLVSVFFPSFVLAAGGHTSSHLPPFWGPIVACGGADRPCNFCELLHSGVHLTSLLATVIIFAIVPLGFLVGGIMIMLAGTSTNLLQRGKRTLWGAVIAGVGAMVAYVVITSVLWLFGNSGDIQVAWPNIVCS